MVSNTLLKANNGSQTGNILLDYNTSTQSHTVHNPTFIYVTANKNVN